VRGGEPSPERRRLALRLFQLREDAGLSQQQLALRLGFSKTKVLKLESGHTTAKTTDVEAWASATGVPAAEVASLREMAQQARAEAFSLRGRSLASLQQEVASRERAARTIRSYYPTGIPGLLQTRAYIEALFAAGHLAVPLTEEGIMARLARQGILHDESKHFEFLLYEGALRWDFAPDTPAHTPRSWSGYASRWRSPTSRSASCPSGSRDPCGGVTPSTSSRISMQVSPTRRPRP
jgi:transcriptional regulator with XRE-family HTH domain